MITELIDSGNVLTGGIYVSSSGKSAGVMSAELGMSILANATVAVCSTGGLSKEDCAQVLANAARFIGVSTGSFLVTSQTSLNQLLSDLENQIFSFPNGKKPANTGVDGSILFKFYLNGRGKEEFPENETWYTGYMDGKGKPHLYNNGALLQELGLISDENNVPEKYRTLSIEEIIQMAPNAETDIIP